MKLDILFFFFFSFLWIWFYLQKSGKDKCYFSPFFYSFFERNMFYWGSLGLKQLNKPLWLYSNDNCVNDQYSMKMTMINTFHAKRNLKNRHFFSSYKWFFLLIEKLEYCLGFKKEIEFTEEKYSSVLILLTCALRLILILSGRIFISRNFHWSMEDGVVQLHLKNLSNKTEDEWRQIPCWRLLFIIFIRR